MKKILLSLSLFSLSLIASDIEYEFYEEELSTQLGQYTIDINQLTKTDPKTGKKHSNERTPLMYASLNNDLDETVSLLDQGADPYIVNPSGFTALLYAAQKGHHAIAATLLATCPDKQKLLEASIKGFTPLSLAQKYEHHGIFKLLTLAQGQTTFSPTCRVHFSPNILSVIMNCINNEKISIQCAMFRFTHGRPAKKFVAKHRKGVAIDAIVDNDYKTDFCIALRYMINNGIAVRESTKGSDEKQDKYYNMHHKYIIFGNNAKDKPLLVTGSCNFTQQAFTQNWENIIIIDDQEAINQFLIQHAHLRKYSKPIDKDSCTCPKDTDPKRQYPRKLHEIEGLA
ncbi:MAG: ankyrin repeat domain-containing protein [Candidatus Dependentiae bacterium]